MKKTSLSVAIAGVIGFGGALTTPQLSVAQEEEMLEEVVVTGSRIRRADLEGFNPGQCY
ncbi:hypothetical protein GCM10011403_09010 [Pseudohongiella nitratireducens]|jgi:hypothetical protein|uniref:TonB-dependent receptor n=1 Tax=Pseudohongiella nitratireducens TaxID=1768907 RepID=A0A917GQ81_9GAMM|nr:hypothetical protein [Pseudohongiella nitratireducens]GGG54037.1 hypothetical protein GCM10011403_09010 [Pseudohongiella nitratireducens]